MSDQDWLKNGIEEARANLKKFPPSFQKREEIVRVVESAKEKSTSSPPSYKITQEKN